MADIIIYPFTIVIFVVFGILICASIARKKRRNRAMMSAPVVVASQQMSHPTHTVQFQAGAANTFQPNPSAPYHQNMQIPMPMPPYQNNQPFQQPYQNVYPQQPPPYPGMPQQSDNYPGFKIGGEPYSSTTGGRSTEESRNTAARY